MRLPAHGAQLRYKDVQGQAQHVQDKGLGCSQPASGHGDARHQRLIPSANTGRVEVKVGEDAESVRLEDRK